MTSPKRTASGHATGAKGATRKVTAVPADGVPDTDEIAVVGEGPSVGETQQGGKERPAGMVTADGQKLKTDHVTFRGRTMVVGVPDEVQLSIMQRFSDQYSAMADSKMVDAKVAVRMSGRAISIIQSVLTDEDDKAWVEDALLRKDFEIMDALWIVEEAMARLKVANAPNREGRRAAGKKSRLVTS